jgi:hypothetical protein
LTSEAVNRPSSMIDTQWNEIVSWGPYPDDGSYNERWPGNYVGEDLLPDEVPPVGPLDVRGVPADEAEADRTGQSDN